MVSVEVKDHNVFRDHVFLIHLVIPSPPLHCPSEHWLLQELRPAQYHAGYLPATSHVAQQMIRLKARWAELIYQYQQIVHILSIAEPRISSINLLTGWLWTPWSKAGLVVPCNSGPPPLCCPSSSTHDTQCLEAQQHSFELHIVYYAGPPITIPILEEPMVCDSVRLSTPTAEWVP